MGCRERPVAGRDRTREGAALVTEELASREFRHDRAAVEQDELAFAIASIEIVDQARHQLLAGAAFTDQQH